MTKLYELLLSGENIRNCKIVDELKKELEAKKRHLERNEGYFSCICEALEIDHKSKHTDMLVAIEAKNKVIAEWKKKYSELSAFDLEIRINALNDLKAAFTFRGHLENSILPEELDAYIDKLTKDNN